MSSAAGSSPTQRILAELSQKDQHEELRRRLSGHRPPDAEVVAALCREALRLVRSDLRRAERLAQATRELATEVYDLPAQAFSHRTLANVLHRAGSYAQARAEYDRALELLEALGDEREIAITRSTAIHNLIYLGDYERAYRWAEAARQVFERDKDHLHLARLRLNYANILYRQDRWEEALDGYARALRELIEHGEPSDVAVCLRTKAVCEISLNDFSSALQSYEQARDYCRRHEMPLLALENEYNIAYLYFQRGEYTRALRFYEAVRAGCEHLGDREHAALCGLDQSEIYLELNLVEEAAELGEAAFALFEGLGMDYEAAKALTMLAIARSRQGREFFAVELLGKARAIFEREDNRVWLGQIDLYQALILYGEGRSVEAAALAQRALDQFSTLGLPTKTALCRVLLARLALDRGDLAEARTLSRTALASLGPLLSPALEYQALFVLGRAEEAAGQPALALTAYREAQARLQRLRSHLQTDELKISFLEDKLIVYESLVALLLAGVPSEARMEESFGFIEMAKSRSLADLLAFRANTLPARTTVRSNLVERIRNLREELNWYYRRIDLQQMKIGEGSQARLNSLREESRKREGSLVRTLRELHTTDREFSSLQAATTIDLAEIRTALPKDALLVEYFIADGTIYGCVVGPQRLEIVPLTVASRTRELHRLLQFQLSKFLLGTAYVTEFRDLVWEATNHHLHGLYAELIAPLEELLDRPRLVIVPHGFLHQIPFQALYDGERYLVDRFTISYSPSASVFYLCRDKRPDWEESALVMGIGDEDAPRIHAEAQTVAGVLDNATLLLDENADAESLRRLGQRCRTLHIATHGVFRRDNPMFSAIQLGDSRLSLFDLYSLRLSAELVVLSGCGTGLNVVTGADELVGLTRGILYAGAHSVLVSLWEVNDASTETFMRAFYRHRLTCRSTSEALRQASRDLRQQHPHPYFWAPFVLVGNPG